MAISIKASDTCCSNSYDWNVMILKRIERNSIYHVQAPGSSCEKIKISLNWRALEMKGWDDLKLIFKTEWEKVIFIN